MTNIYLNDLLLMIDYEKLVNFHNLLVVSSMNTRAL